MSSGDRIDQVLTMAKKLTDENHTGTQHSHTFTNPLSLLYRFSSYQWEEGGDDSSMEKPQRTLRRSYQSTGNGKEDTCFQSWGWRYDPSNNSKWSKPITYYQWIIQKMINFYALLLQWTFCPIAALLHQWKFEPLNNSKNSHLNKWLKCLNNVIPSLYSIIIISPLYLCYRKRGRLSSVMTMAKTWQLCSPCKRSTTALK